MIFNASEDNLPDFDNEMHKYSPQLDEVNVSAAEKKYGINILPSRVALNPINKLWIQGIPPIFINELAPPKSRALDALACSIRSLVDRTKTRHDTKTTQLKCGKNIYRKQQLLSSADVQTKSATEWAVEQHPAELSSFCLLAQASSHLKQCEKSAIAPDSIFCGLRLLVNAVQLVLERAIKDVQIHNIITLLTVVMEYPICLFQFGPTYHIIHSCVLVLAQKINEIKHDRDNTLIEKALCIYNGSRSVLEHHRSKLPLLLQCHELPIPCSTTHSRRPVIDVSNVSFYFSCNKVPAILFKEISGRVADSCERSTGHFGESDQVLLALLNK